MFSTQFLKPFLILEFFDPLNPPFLKKKLEGLRGPEGPAREEPRSGDLSSFEYLQGLLINELHRTSWLLDHKGNKNL